MTPEKHLLAAVKAFTDEGERIECASFGETDYGLRLYDSGGELAGFVPYDRLRRVARWRVPVVSTSIRSVGYDEGADALEIEFRSGGVYRYLDVPRNAFEDLLRADSHGRYFHEHVRGEYDYRRIG